jgi:hypothetical protein
MNLVDLHRFVTVSVGWIFNDPLMQCITRMKTLYGKYVERLVFTAMDGVEHSAYIMATHFPELMTPELHVRVVPAHDVFRVPEMQIADDDALFGPLKATYQGLMPAAVPIVEPRQRRDYHDEGSDDSDDGSDDYGSDDYDYDDARG